mgnify:CR=1 FL=1
MCSSFGEASPPTSSIRRGALVCSSLAAVSKDATDAGINPYVFQKSSGFAKNFSKDELATMGARLVRMSHDAHRGKTDFDIELERFVLGM